MALVEERPKMDIGAPRERGLEECPKMDIKERPAKEGLRSVQRGT